MRTLHPAFRVSDIAASLEFYSAIGYELVGNVRGTALGDLALIKLPGDEFAALELVQDPHHMPVEVGRGLSHLAIQVDSVEGVRAALSAAGFESAEVEHPGGEAGPQTSWVTDPDGYRLELTEWPSGHPAGLTAADFR